MRKRHSMLGNSWHIGVAVFILSAILSNAIGPVPQHGTTLHYKSCAEACFDVSCQNSPPREFNPAGAGPHMQAAHAFRHQQIRFGPGPEPAVFCCVNPTDCPVWHLELAKVAKHPLDELPPIDPSLTFAIHNLQRAGLGILQFGNEMLSDIRLLMEIQRCHRRLV